MNTFFLLFLSCNGRRAGISCPGRYSSLRMILIQHQVFLFQDCQLAPRGYPLNVHSFIRFIPKSKGMITCVIRSRHRFFQVFNSPTGPRFIIVVIVVVGWLECRMVFILAVYRRVTWLGQVDVTGAREGGGGGCHVM